jgi:predicted nucleotidyltransferase
MLTTLPSNETMAIEEFQKKILARFGITEIILFGSKARGEENRYSDLDILVLLEQEPSISIEEEIIDIGFEIELKYDVVLVILVHSKAFWDSKGILMPIHKEIERDGIPI